MSATKTKRDLEKEIAEVKEQLSDIKVLGAQLEGKKRKELAEKVARLEGEFPALVRKVDDLTTNFHTFAAEQNKISKTVRELVRANNSASTVINCIEQWLDANHAGWDGGTREAVQRKADLMKERAALAQEAQSEGVENDRRLEIAARLRELSGELGSEAVDVPMVLSLYLQARDLERAREFVEEVRASGIALSKEVSELVEQLESRLAKLDEEGGPKLPPPGERRIITP